MMVIDIGANVKIIKDGFANGNVGLVVNRFINDSGYYPYHGMYEYYVIFDPDTFVLRPDPLAGEKQPWEMPAINLMRSVFDRIARSDKFHFYEDQLEKVYD